jgi:hypothetical protein
LWFLQTGVGFKSFDLILDVGEYFIVVVLDLIEVIDLCFWVHIDEEWFELEAVEVVPVSRVEILGLYDVGQADCFLLYFEFAGAAGGEVAGGVTCLDVLVGGSEVIHIHG